MNVYRLQFQTWCPVDGTVIDYDWTIQSTEPLLSAVLRDSVKRLPGGVHEEIADALFAVFRGKQCLKAMHVGEVLVETVRGAAESRPGIRRTGERIRPHRASYRKV